jgi:hypothetical protein
VSKSVTVTAPPGVYAGISVFDGTNGIDIDTAGVDVIVRGLAINGQGGDNGINFANGNSLVVENCTINGVGVAGIAALAAGADNDHPARVHIVASTISRNDSGLELAGGPIAVTVTRSAITGNAAGIKARSTIAGVENALTVQSSTISNGTFGSGIDVNTTVAGAVMVVAVGDTTISRNFSNGIQATGSGQTLLTIAGNVMTGNYHGVSISGPAAVKAVLGENTISRNRQCGVFVGGTTLSRGDNTINDNVTCATTSAMGSIGGL